MPSSIEAFEEWLQRRYEMSDQEALLTEGAAGIGVAIRCTTFLICLVKLRELMAETAHPPTSES